MWRRTPFAIAVLAIGAIVLLSGSDAQAQYLQGPQNTPPVVSDGALALSEDADAVGTLPSVTDPDDDSWTYSIVTQPAHGNVVFISASAGTYRYTPLFNYCTTDAFTFRATDGNDSGGYNGPQASNVGTIAITVACVNDTPTVSPSSSTIQVYGWNTVNRKAGGEGLVTLDLVNDIDDTAFTLVPVTFPTKGSFVVNDYSTGEFEYETSCSSALEGADSCDDSLQYRVRDSNASGGINGIQTSNLVTVTINVVPGAPPSVTFTSAAQASAGESGVITVIAELSAASVNNVQVPFTVSNGTANIASDYTVLTSSPLVIPAGSLSGQIRIAIVDDQLDEDDETLIAAMNGNPINASRGNTVSHVATITDDDEPPTVRLSASPTKIAEGGGGAMLTATLSAVSSHPCTVELSLGGSAAEGTDYTLSSASITIVPGVRTGVATFAGITDALVEGTETAVIDIASTSEFCTELGQQRAVVSIADSGDAGTDGTSSGEGFDVVAINAFTGEECGHTTSVEAGDYELPFDPASCAAPDDDQTIRIFIMATRGDVTIKSYYESALSAEEDVQYDAGTTDLNETVAAEMIGDRIRDDGDSFRPMSFDAILGTLLGDISLADDGVSGALAMARGCIACLMAKGVEASALGFAGWEEVLAGLAGGGLGDAQLSAIATAGAASCSFEEENLRTTLDDVQRVLPVVSAFLAVNVAGDATAAAAATADEQERSAWATLIRALDVDDATDAPAFAGATGSAVARLVERARARGDYSLMTDPNRARLLAGVIAQAREGDSGTLGDDVLPALLASVEIGEEGMSGEELRAIGKSLGKAIANSSSQTYAQIANAPSVYANFIANQYQRNEYADPETIAQNIDGIAAMLKTEADNIIGCLGTSSGSPAECYEEYSLEQWGIPHGTN